MIKIYYGSGRARCSICDEIITKKELQVNFIKGSGAYTQSENTHLTCINKKAKDLY